MNVLVVQQLAWGLRIGHEVARVLHRQGHTLSALVHGAETHAFVTSQRDVAYRDVWFADPLYDEGADRVSAEQIAEIESRYGLDSLWRIIYSDRVLAVSFLSSRRFLARKPVSNDYMLSVCWSKYRMAREAVERTRPDYVLAPVVGSLANYLLYLECRHRNVPFVTLAFSRFGNAFYTADDQYFCSRIVQRRFEKLATCPDTSPKYGAARQLYARIRGDDPESRPTYARRTGVDARPARRLARGLGEAALVPMRIAVALYRNRRVMGLDNIWAPANSRWNDIRNILINLRERFTRPDAQGACLRSLDAVGFRYVYFPLQVEPEITLSVFAPAYANQLEVCRRVALALPRGVRLLVKEHPNMVVARTREFYEDLKGLLNVELVHSSVPSHALFTSDRCAGVLVISSTVGFEAAMSGRPVVLLAPVQYAALPTVYRAASLEDGITRLRALCRDEIGIDPATVERENVAYLAALLETSFSFDYFERWTTGSGDISADVIVEAVHERVRSGDW